MNDVSQTPENANRPARKASRVDSALRWSLLVLGLVLLIVAGGWIWLNRPQREVYIDTGPLVAPKQREAPAEQMPSVHFTDITEEAGIHFAHTNGACGQKLLPETMGGGCAFLDYDNDGDQDLLLVNSCHWPDQPQASDAPEQTTLYQNDGTGRFMDVSEGSGLNLQCFGMGAAVGDYDNDGWIDVFITAVGGNHLFHNEHGKFAEVTDTAQVAGSDREWSTGCGWFDYNNDGRLDLFVANYVRWSAEIDLRLDRTLDGETRAYLPPTSFEGTFPYLYRNDGDGKFTDVSADAGLDVRNPATQLPMAKSLGLATVDLDRDGWIDVVVANDTVQNFVFHNRGDGTFDEVGAPLGIAYDAGGQARGAMGVDAAHFRNDDDMGIAIGNFANEMTALYVAQGDTMIFSDEAIATGLGPATRLELTFGLFFFDYDLDGRLDILAANGHLEEEIHSLQASQQYRQPPQLFWNAGSEQMTEFPAVPPEKIGPDFHRRMVGRGAAYADIDSDGDLDVLITACGDSPRLLRNDQHLGNHWIRFRLTGVDCNTNAIGAWIEVEADGQSFRRQVTATRSYLSQCELPVTIGLGQVPQVDRVIIYWPDGSRQTADCPELDQTYEIVQGRNADKP